MTVRGIELVLKVFAVSSVILLVVYTLNAQKVYVQNLVQAQLPAQQGKHGSPIL